MDGATAANGFDLGSGLPTIKDASGRFGTGKLRGFPTRSAPLKNPVPGIAVGPNPKHNGGFGATP